MFIYLERTHNRDTPQVPQGTEFEYRDSPFEVFLVNEKILSSILVLTVANWEHSVGDGAIGVLLTIPLAQDIAD